MRIRKFGLPPSTETRSNLLHDADSFARQFSRSVCSNRLVNRCRHPCLSTRLELSRLARLHAASSGSPPPLRPPFPPPLTYLCAGHESTTPASISPLVLCPHHTSTDTRRLAAGGATLKASSASALLLPHTTRTLTGVLRPLPTPCSVTLSPISHHRPVSPETPSLVIPIVSAPG